MKTIVTTLAALFITAMAFSQTPPTLKEENLKGNVYRVIYANFNYSENFGEPKEGKLRFVRDCFYDGLGRAILFSYGSDDKYFWVRYNQRDNNTIASMLEFFTEKCLKHLEDYTTKEQNFFNYREITYNSDNIVTKYDVSHNDTYGVYELNYRKTATHIGNGTYECKLYGPDGNTDLDYKETYNSKGQLTMVDNDREYNRIRSWGSPDIEIPHAGTYKYNNKGQLVSYQEQKDSQPTIYESVYNEHGDIKERYASIVNKGVVSAKGLTAVYEDYKYDDKGNWIYRIISNGEKKFYIERRQIEYYNSAEELDSLLNKVYSNYPVVNIR